jgi:hypothetical protein
MPKLSPQLEDRLQSSKPGDVVDVVVEVAEDPKESDSLPLAKPERYDAAQQRFVNRNQGVTKAVEDAGGQVLAQTWLGSALKVRMPVENIERLLSFDHISLIDLPRTLTRG